MTPEDLAEAVRDALADLVAEGALTAQVPDVVHVERPKNRDHGDYATNVALVLAKAAGVAPRSIAEALADRLASTPGIAAAEVAGPGFVNVRFDAATQGELAPPS